METVGDLERFVMGVLHSFGKVSKRSLLSGFLN